MNKRQAGYTRIQIIGAIAALLVVGAIAYATTRNNSADTPAVPTIEDTSPTPTSAGPAIDDVSNGSAENDPNAEVAPHGE